MLYNSITMFDIVTIGAGVKDVLLMSDQFKFLQSSVFEGGMGECVSLGAKIELDKVVHSTGGGATNAAVTFSRLGYDTATICRVGDDGAGRDILIDLQREGIKTTLVQRVVGGSTGYSTLLTAPGGERTVLVYRGVSAEFTKADIPWGDMKTRWIYMTSLGGNLPLTKLIAQTAAKKNISVAYNPGSKEIAAGLPAFKTFLKHIRVFTLNREEAEKLTKEKDIARMFKKLATPGNVVLITDGHNGAYGSKNGHAYFVTTSGTRAVSATGAGDAFGSGFVASFMQTGDLSTSLAVGTYNAECVIKHIGAKDGIIRKWPTQAQLKTIHVKPFKA